MDEDRTAEGMEHLQRAAKELVAAARSFLDVVEDVVEDPERFSSTASSLVDLVRDGLGALAEHRPDAPWAANAWTSDAWTSDSWTADASGAPAGEAPDGPDGTPEDDVVPSADAPEATAPDRASDPAREPTRRVRRIAVD